MSEEGLPSLEQLYEEAKAALATKDYERAIRLLREIVVQDAEYEDASRLLAQAIAWQRRKWWQDPRLLVVAVAFLLLAVLIWAMQPNSPLRVALALPTATVTATPTSTPTPRPTSTPRPTTTPTPAPTAIPLAWHRLYGGHIFPRDTITAIVVDPEDPKVFYVGTSNAGIYKSIDGGMSWQPMHHGLGRASIQSLVIDPQDSRTVYAGVLQGGVYKTTDGGEHWQAANRGIDAFGGSGGGAIAMDPQDSRHLYFAPESEIYESTDGGLTWTVPKVGDTCPSQIFARESIVVHPFDSKILFASHWDLPDCTAGVYKSEDSGRTWTLTGLLTEQVSSISVEVSLQGRAYVYALTRSGVLYGSSDGGDTWQQLPQENCSALAVHPQEGVLAFCNGALVRTEDGGATWQILSRLEGVEIRAISVSASNPNILLMGGSSFYASPDGGVSWTERISGLGGNLVELILDPVETSTLYAEEKGRCLLYRSSNSGRTWELLLPGGGCGATFDADGETLYLPGGGGRIWFSQDRGQTWMELAVPLPPDQQFHIAAHPRKAGTLFAVSFHPPDIYLSTNRGGSWEKIGQLDTSITFRLGQYNLVFGFEEEQIMYLVTFHPAFRSQDGGKTWRTCDRTPMLALSASRLAIDPRDSNRLILATRGNGVLISKDGCQNWQPSNNGLGNLFVNTVAIHPQNPDTVYAGTDGGAYVSYDGGEHWGVVNEGLLGATVVYSIVVDPQDPDNVYSATPYGIFRLERR